MNLNPFDNWTTADWLNLRLFVPDVVAPLLDEEKVIDVEFEEVENDEESDEFEMDTKRNERIF